MRRRWRIALGAVFVLAVAAVVVVAVRTLTAVPAYTASALSKALGRRVEIDGIHVDAGLWLEIKARGVRVYSGETAEGTPILSVAEAVGRASWARVFTGQVVPVDWELESPVVQISTKAGGASEFEFPISELVARNAILYIDAGERGSFRVDALRLALHRRALLAGLAGAAVGKVSNEAGPLGRFDVKFEVGGAGVSVNGEVREVPLERLTAYSPSQVSDWIEGSGGQIGGTFRVDYAPDMVRAEVDLSVDALRLDVAGLRGPIRPKESRFAIGIELTDGVWVVRPEPVKLDAFELTGTIRVGSGRGARVRADLALAPFSPGRPARGKVTFVSLMGLRFQTWERLERRIERGTFADVKVRVDLPLADLAASLSFQRPMHPDEFRVTGRLVDGRFQAVDGAAPLDRMNGRFEFSGDRASVQNLTMRSGDTALPVLSASMDGFAYFLSLPYEERELPSGPGVGLPGLGPTFAALRSEPTGTAVTRQPVIEFSDLWLGYPAFVLPIRNAWGRLQMPEGHLVAKDAEAVIGGGLASLDVDWQYEPARVDVAVVYLPGPVPAPPKRGSTWASGTFSIDSADVAGWTLYDLSGDFDIQAAQMRFLDLRADLGGGPFQSSGSLDLGQRNKVPLDFDFGLKAARATDTLGPLSVGDAEITGTAALDGNVRGFLGTDEGFLDSCDLSVAVDVRNGTLQNLPVALQIARLPSLQGFRALFGRPLPFDSLTGQLGLHLGVLELEEFAILGPEVRVLIGGTVEVNTPQKQTDLLVAFLFLQTLDDVIARLPFVGRLILGKDSNLVTMSFRMQGPWDNLSVTPATPATLRSAADWTSTWLRRLRGLLPGGRQVPEPEGSPSPGGERVPGRSPAAAPGESAPLPAPSPEFLPESRLGSQIEGGAGRPAEEAAGAGARQDR